MSTQSCRVSQYMIHYADEFGELIHALSRQKMRTLRAGEVHTLRVTIRRLRACLWALRTDARYSAQSKKLRSDLRMLGATLGRIRELDVAIQDTITYGIKMPNLCSERNKALKQAIRILHRASVCKLSKRITAFARSVEGPLRLRTALDPLVKQLMRSRKEIRPLSQQHAHRMRLLLKKSRYVLESIGSVPSLLINTQQLLGRLRDLSMLQSRVGTARTIQADTAVIRKRLQVDLGPALELAAQKLSTVR